jgi:solute carrier family 1 (neuronal/epithelial high affinity glutamate transporter), member 1
VIPLTAVVLPVRGSGLILAINWFLDRLRTTVNVYGDSVGAGVIDRYVET